MTTTIRAELAIYAIGAIETTIPQPKLVVESRRPGHLVRLTLPGAEPIEVSREDLEAALMATRAVRAAADRAIQAATDRLSDLYGDAHHQEQAARGAPPETLEVLVERAVTVGRAAMASNAQAVQGARLEGARLMRDHVAAMCAPGSYMHEAGNRHAIHETWLEIRTLDPAVVVRPAMEKG